MPRVDLGLLISFAQIKTATANFDKKNLIGVGGFGKVYKGVLSNRVEVAVKRASSRSQQGFREFRTEIEVLSQIRHRHLVSLIGYCDEGSEMILVYEYMEKGSLRNYLYGNESPSLSWKQRLEICIEAAKGLHYLHTGYSQTIIHRDVKSTNILLGEGYLAKLSDFGLSQLAASIGETHFSTAVKGTFGYLDPEYFKTQKLTDKSDVYSFGVTLLEVLCARPVIDQSLAREEINLAEWALMSLSRGQLEKIIDPGLVGEINENSLRKFGEIAEKCLQEYGMDRPAIGDVLWNLEYCLHLQETEVIPFVRRIPSSVVSHGTAATLGDSRVENNDGIELEETEVRRQPCEDSGTSEAQFPASPFVRWIPSSVVSHGTAATSGDSSYDNNVGIKLDSSCSAAGRKLKHIVVSIKKRLQKRTPDVKEMHLLRSPRVHLGLLISFAQIKIATNNFDENNLIGRGSFGNVYKGVLSNGVEVAVKRASSQFRHGFSVFQTEIEILSKVRHHHLVSLIGYCDEGSEMILVYEYMEKGSLGNYLYGNESRSLSWKQRLEICIEAAKGLHYLHTGYSQAIIHRDIKSTNILLGEGYLAKVSDFGLSKLGPSIGKTYVSTVVKGTVGYLDPEYFKRQQITHKSDVYSFGVLLLEVLCARRVIDQSLAREEISLVEWALMWLSRGQLEKIIDPRIVGEINENSVKKFGEIAEKCLQEYGMDRPELGDVLWNLEYCLHLQETEVIPFVRRIPSSVVSHGSTAATLGDSRVENNDGIELD